jgi:hypothetical protein
MNRLQYRRFADGHESLVANHTVGVGSSGNQAAIRWYEIRNLSSTPTIYQQGTYAATTDNRWLGSMAMDQAGDIALGYSVSSSTVFPSIRYTGRLGQRHARNSTPGRGDHRRRCRIADHELQPVGRLQHDGRRPHGRLHLLVHAGVLRGDQRPRMADPRRVLQIPSI